MKRVKIMLTAITVLAVVGGALAFKAQKFALKRICTGTALDVCPNLAIRSTITESGTQSFFYTQVADDATNCNSVTACSTQTYLKAEPAQ